MSNKFKAPPTMKVGELIRQLSEFHPDLDVEILAEGKAYPALITQTIDEQTMEIGCGWIEIEHI